MKLSAVCQKHKENQTNGSGDIVLRKNNFIQISQLVDFLANFLTHFALLPVFTKSATKRKRAVVERIACDFRL